LQRDNERFVVLEESGKPTEGRRARVTLVLDSRSKPEQPCTGRVNRREAIWESGVGITVLGGLVLVLSALWVAMCAAGSIGPCLGTPFQGRQGFLELLGVVMLVAGLLLVLAGKRPTAAHDIPGASS
jgi:predicted phage tail protein